MWGLGLLASVVLFVLIGSCLVSESYANFTNTRLSLQSPTLAHPFGTDVVGRDILARTIYGGQISLLIGIAAVGVSLMVGVPVGALSGYYGGVVDSLLMRSTEAVLTIPPLFLLIVAAKFLGDTLPHISLGGRLLSGSVGVIILVVGLTSWPALARLVRAQFLTLREREFVLAAQSLGASQWRIIVRHLLPNSLAPILVHATLGIANAMLSEAYVSFLGLGVRQPTATWGNMLEEAPRYLAQAPWLWCFPGGLILLTVLAFHAIGDGLQQMVTSTPTS
jgi:peptide/nickel transport system permease protein